MLTPKQGGYTVREIKPSNSNTSLVVQANKLVEARYKFSIIQTKIIHFLISQVRQEDEDFTTYRLKVKDLAQVLGVADGSIYRKIKEETYDILKKPLVIKEPDGDLQIGWLAKAKYYDKKGYVDLSFHPDLKPYLLMIKEGYTKHYLTAVLNISSTYAVRIYVLLKQYEKLGERTITVDEFRDMLQLSSSAYDLYGNIKSRILKPAQSEFKSNPNVDIEFSFRDIKTKRKVTAIKFTITRKKQLSLPLSASEQENPDNALTEYQAKLVQQLHKLNERLKDPIIPEAPHILSKIKTDPEHVERCIIHARNELDANKSFGAGMMSKWITKKSAIPGNIQTDAERRKAKQKQAEKEAAAQKAAADKEAADAALVEAYVALFESQDEATQAEIYREAEEKAKAEKFWRFKADIYSPGYRSVIFKTMKERGLIPQ